MHTHPLTPPLCFHDAQEQAAALTGWSQDYLQLSPGLFRGSLGQLTGSGIKLFVEQVQQSVLQRGALGNNMLAFGLVLDSVGDSMFCGQACSRHDVHLFSGTSGFEFRSAHQHTILGVELAQNSLPLSASAPALHLPGQACTLSLTPATLAALRLYLLGLYQAALRTPQLLTIPSVVGTVADYLLEQLSQAAAPWEQVPARAPTQAKTDVKTQWKLVQKACNLVQNQIDSTPTVAQLCLDLGVSRRTLQNSFNTVLNLSPLSYLKALRLSQARNALKTMDCVTDAATASGFWHFGHFSQDYKAMFGERPSDTFRYYH
jgi:AraC family ethanolamine operon transcriptional activator